jgi:hypothetical protein
LETLISIHFDQNLPRGEIDYKNTKERRLHTGESYRVAEAQSENKTGEEIGYTDLLTEFVQGVEVLKTLCVIVPVTF